jgi:hypothetical protein
MNSHDTSPGRVNGVRDLDGAIHRIPQDTFLAQRRRPRLRRAALMTAGALAVGIAVAACGGSPSTPGVATGSTTNTTAASPSARGSTQATGLLAYSSCMRSHGVPNFPDPDSSGGIPKPAAAGALQEVSNSQSQAATNDCRHLLPAGKSLGGQPSQTVTAQDQHYYLHAAACMRSHGFTNFPDPVFSGGSVNFPVPASIDANSPQFAQAVHACQKLIPAGLPKG